ncbi:MAG: NrfD/PsrC family molybdoenzyme membrane anchor subunit [Pseudomonadota bacterium]
MKIAYREIEGRSSAYWLLLGALGALAAAGAAGAWTMEHHGHVVTGMTNQVVWGLPHVFAVLLIVAASGALNVATVASVFGREVYKPLAPLSGLLAIALLAGGLAVLMLDLGRADRITVAMTRYNFTSIFALNVFLYTGFFAVVALYLWTMMERRMNRFARLAGYAAFAWRLVLTTGTGSIFGFLVARQAYDSALLAPMFIAMSFAYGLAVYLPVLAAAHAWSGRALDPAILRRLKNLLMLFIVAVLYFVAVFHLTNLYFARQAAFERFILLDGGVYPALFWGGQIALGTLAPLALLAHPRLGATRGAIVAASLLVIAGALAQMYVTIVGAQAFPLDLFPGLEASSSFFDGRLHPYAPSLPETALGLGGVAVAGIIVLLAVKLLPFLPERADAGAAGVP